MPTKLKIKVGHIEFEYEGDAVYDNEAVKDLFSHIESFAVAVPSGNFDALPTQKDLENGDEGAGDQSGISNLSVQTVAARLGGKSAKDVVLAAAGHLQICQGMKSFSRKELLLSMQNAHGYYNQTMSGNLSAVLKRLVAAKQIMTLTGEQMSLSAGELARLSAKIVTS
ncbi:hypothetical protein GGQ91_001068 [Methylobacterium fujisawaense]|uniref:Uncharacterized protein n=1 Tax=Methylobacterium fujisawaense TaxID=107400 RepID=A0ABR6D6H2_9HYPH|nr:hypothetical protein [Methylobacterium fujisawaense]MBA9061691.1 hypothetical protein [Methylobacterium fujisawaense]